MSKKIYVNVNKSLPLVIKSHINLKGEWTQEQFIEFQKSWNERNK